MKDVDIETGLHREHRSVGRTLTHHHDVATPSRAGLCRALKALIDAAKDQSGSTLHR